jgi:hypothetical protein
MPFAETCWKGTLPGAAIFFSCFSAQMRMCIGAEQALRPDDVLKQLLRTFTNGEATPQVPLRSDKHRDCAAARCDAAPDTPDAEF